MKYHAMVREFNEGYGSDAPLRPGLPGSLGDRCRLVRAQLIVEEHGELLHGLAARDLIECLDALGDSEYVVCGTIVACGADRAGQLLPSYEQTSAGPPSVPSADLALILSGDYLQQSGLLVQALAAGDWKTIAGQALVVRARLAQLWAAFRVPEALRFDVFEEIHRSNMTKFGADGKPVINEAGRVVKGPNYVPPDLLGVLRRHYGEDYEPPVAVQPIGNALSGGVLRVVQ